MAMSEAVASVVLFGRSSHWPALFAIGVLICYVFCVLLQSSCLSEQFSLAWSASCGVAFLSIGRVWQNLVI